MAKRLPPDIQRALEQIEPQLRDAFIEAVQRITDNVELGRIEALIREGRIDDALRALNINPTLFSGLHEAERAGLVAGGNLVLSGLKIRDPFTGSRVVLGFDGRALRAEQWAAQASSRLITEIVDDQMQMAREVIRAGIEAGRNPRSIALELVGRIDKATGKRTGGFIGLDSQRWRVARDVLNAMQTPRGVRSLVTVHRSGAVTVKYKSVNDATANRILSAYRRGEGVSAADIEISRRQLNSKLLLDRGETIARTEALNALRAGRHEGYEQLIQSGKVRADQVTVTWSATMDGRTRDSHQALNGQKIRFGQMFTSPLTGARMEYPGDATHGAPAEEIISCRCYAEYSIRYL